MSDTASEGLLERYCNLIKSGTHVADRRVEGGNLYVIDKEHFKFSEEDAGNQALRAAVSSYKSPKGCVGCKLYAVACLPTPVALKDNTTQEWLPAEKTRLP